VKTLLQKWAFADSDVLLLTKFLFLVII